MPHPVCVNSKSQCPVVWDSIHLMMAHIVKLSGVTTSMHHSSSSPGLGLHQGPNHSLKPCFLRHKQKPGCPNNLCQFSGTKAKSYENETPPDKKLWWKPFKKNYRFMFCSVISTQSWIQNSFYDVLFIAIQNVLIVIISIMRSNYLFSLM